MRKALPTPRRVRLEDEDDMDLADHGVAFLGRPTAPSGSIFQEKVWPPPSSRLEDPLLSTSELGLSSVVDDVMGQSGEGTHDVNARLLSDRDRRSSGSSYRFIGHSRDPSLASNYSDTPLLSRSLLPNWQDGSRATVSDDAFASRVAAKAHEAGNRRPPSTSSAPGAVNVPEMRGSLGGNTGSHEEASTMRSRGGGSHGSQLLVDTGDANQVREIPPLYHTIIPDPLPPRVDDDDEEQRGHTGRAI